MLIRRLLAMLFGLSAAPLAAQAPASSDTLVADRRLTADSGTVLVHLRKDGVYRAIVTPYAGPLQLRPVRTNGPATFVSPAANAPRGTWELYVTGTGEFAIELPAIPAGEAVQLRVIDDHRAAHALAERSNHQMSIGVGAAGGMHGTYSIDGSPPVAGGGGGRDRDTYLLIDGGRWLSGALGASRQTVPLQDVLVTYFYVEPRARLLTLASPAGMRMDAGVSFRFAFGNANSISTNDPTLVAPGVFVATHLSRRTGNRGFSLLLGAYYSWLSNTQHKPDAHSPGATVGLAWLP